MRSLESRRYWLWYWWRYERRRKFWRWVAMHMPAPLVYWATIRLWAFMTSGERGDVHPDDVTFSGALGTWDKELLDSKA